MLLRLSLALSLALCACNADYVSCPPVSCPDGGACAAGPAASGLATLRPHTSEADYLGSVISFEHATTVDDGTLLNDWDLSLTQGQFFRVNTVTDDQSWIVDLGRITFAEVPVVVVPEDYPVGEYLTHDILPATLEHVYLVRTIDSNTRQYAAFRVLALDASQGVTLQWVRSSDPEQVVFERGEAAE